MFDGLVADYSLGFVQIDWSPPGALPEHIAEDVALDAAGGPAFHVELATHDLTATLSSHDPRVESLIGVYRLKNVLAVRVKLRNH